jgi:hypothetical protein
MKKNSTLSRIITKVNCFYGAPMGRQNVGNLPDNKTIFDCKVPMNGAYDVGGVYWGLGSELRVSYTKDLTFIHFYRKE